MGIEYDFDNHSWIVTTKPDEPTRPYLTIPVETITELLRLIKECSERNLMFIACRADIGYKIALEHSTDSAPFWDERP